MFTQKKSVLLIVFLSCFSFLYPQLTNTKKWRKTEKDSLDNGLIVYDEKKYLVALPIFENIYRNHPNEEFLKYIYGKCALCRSDKYEDAYRVLSDVYSKNKKVEDIEYDLASAAHYIGKFDEATSLIDAYLANRRTSREGKKNGQQLKKYINNAIYFTAIPTKAKITNLGNIINSPKEEYVPAITADESVLIFTYRGPKCKGDSQEDGLMPEDVFMSAKQNDQYQPPVPLDSINTTVHDAAVSLSHDGQILFIYRDSGDDHGDLYESRLIGETFSSPKKLRGQVNSYSWDGHCSLSPDGKILYFSSERGGGYGGRDIYKATLMPDSTWGNVTNLGDSINTALDDDAPFIHPDGITLYYSSKGRNSMGGYDIFQSTMAIGDSVFRVTENMGYPVNSPGDDIYFVLSAIGNNGYYSSGKKGGEGMKDIYLVEPNLPSQRILALLKGKTVVGTEPAEVKIKVEVPSANNKVYKEFSSNSKTGNYLVTLPPGNDYKITYTYKDQPQQTYTLSTKDITGYNEKINNITFNAPDTAKTMVTPTVEVVTTPTVVNTPTLTKVQEKNLSYLDTYGDLSTEGLEFRVQIAAFKFPKNYTYKHLKGLGNVENVLLDDGITRITIGGKFNTLREAEVHNKKVIAAGQKDAFVTAIYKGKRVYVEQLVELGIFLTK